MQIFNRKPSSKILLIVSFLTGLCIVGMEITASRILAPYFGTSTFIWSNVIAVVLLSLAVGYYLGGRFSEKHNSNVLFVFITVAGIIFVALPFIAGPLIRFCLNVIYDANPTGGMFALCSLLASLLLFGPALFFLGMVSPMMVKVYSQETGAGDASGKIFAISTIGSIIGTILPTYLFLPMFGTQNTTLIFAVTLVLVGAIPLGLRKFGYSVLTVLVVFFLGQSIPVRAQLALYEVETPYHHIKVIEDKDQNRYMVFNEAVSVESVYKKGDVLTGAFYDYFSTLPKIINKPQQDVLILGLAGATMPRQLNYFYGDAVNIDAVEIDAKTIEIARNYFDLDDLKLNIINQDGRIYLQQTDKKYDIVIVDVFENELYVPWTFTTKEFWGLVKTRLNEGGLVSINVHSISNDSSLLRYITNTQAAVFSNVYFTDYRKGRGFSYMITGSDSELDFNIEQINDKLKPAAAAMLNTTKINFDPAQKILTDDWAPIESLTEHSAEVYRRQKLLVP